jgi:hypothetical protein
MNHQMKLTIASRLTTATSTLDSAMFAATEFLVKEQTVQKDQLANQMKLAGSTNAQKRQKWKTALNQMNTVLSDNAKSKLAQKRPKLLSAI